MTINIDYPFGFGTENRRNFDIRDKLREIKKPLMKIALFTRNPYYATTVRNNGSMFRVC